MTDENHHSVDEADKPSSTAHKPSPLARTGHFIFGVILLLLPFLHTAMILMPWFLLRQFVSLFTLASLLIAAIGWMLHASLLRTIFVEALPEERSLTAALFLFLYLIPYAGSFAAPLISILWPSRIALLDLPLAFATALVAFIMLRHAALPKMGSQLTALFRHNKPAETK